MNNEYGKQAWELKSMSMIIRSVLNRSFSVLSPLISSPSKVVPKNNILLTPIQSMLSYFNFSHYPI
jgi:hypothetical protein